MKEVVDLVMKRVVIDIPEFSNYHIISCSEDRFNLEIYVDNLNIDSNWTMGYLKSFDFHHYFKLLGIREDQYLIDLKFKFSPSDFYVDFG